MQLLSVAISDILLGDTDITDITGSGNIWHARLPQQKTDGETSPAETNIYFYTYAVRPNPTKSGRSEVDEHMVRVVVAGTDDEKLAQVARYVRLALDRIDPGTYSGLYIQGSDFLNAYFEPEGEYQLEWQEWILEFKFRVIDPDIRVPGGTIPSAPGFAGNYSTSEQVWPYSKDYGSGRTIYWRTWIFSAPINSGLNALTGLIVAETLRIVNASQTILISGTPYAGASVELNTTQATYRINLPTGTNSSVVTIWYTKP